jgi:hypothetical protein
MSVYFSNEAAPATLAFIIEEVSLLLQYRSFCRFIERAPFCLHLYDCRLGKTYIGANSISEQNVSNSIISDFDLECSLLFCCHLSGWSDVKINFVSIHGASQREQRGCYEEGFHGISFQGKELAQACHPGRW